MNPTATLTSVTSSEYAPRSATFEITSSMLTMTRFLRLKMALFQMDNVNTKEIVRFLEIPEYRGYDVGRKLYNEALKISWETYQLLINVYSWQPEDAVFVLPLASAIDFTITLDFRDWANFLEEDCDESAHWELRTLGEEILKHLYINAPGDFLELNKKYFGNAKWELKLVESGENQ